MNIRYHRYTRGIVAVALASIVLICGAAAQTLSEAVLESSRAHLINTLIKGIVLNEKFEMTVTSRAATERRGLRRMVEDFQEESVDPQLNKLVKLLSSGNDLELTVVFFRYLISTSNSADEEPDYALGRVFYYNPDLVVDALQLFDPAERKVILRALDRGWANVRTELAAQSSQMNNRDERFKRLQTLGTR
jgi:hypothetical protein